MKTEIVGGTRARRRSTPSPPTSASTTSCDSKLYREPGRRKPRASGARCRCARRRRAATRPTSRSSATARSCCAPSTRAGHARGQPASRSRRASATCRNPYPREYASFEPDIGSCTRARPLRLAARSIRSPRRVFDPAGRKNHLLPARSGPASCSRRSRVLARSAGPARCGSSIASRRNPTWPSSWPVPPGSLPPPSK